MHRASLAFFNFSEISVLINKAAALCVIMRIFVTQFDILTIISIINMCHNILGFHPAEK